MTTINETNATPRNSTFEEDFSLEQCMNALSAVSVNSETLKLQRKNKDLKKELREIRKECNKMKTTRRNFERDVKQQQLNLCEETFVTSARAIRKAEKDAIVKANMRNKQMKRNRKHARRARTEALEEKVDIYDQMLLDEQERERTIKFISEDRKSVV